MESAWIVERWPRDGSIRLDRRVYLAESTFKSAYKNAKRRWCTGVFAERDARGRMTPRYVFKVYRLDGTLTDLTPEVVLPKSRRSPRYAPSRT